MKTISRITVLAFVLTILLALPLSANAAAKISYYFGIDVNTSKQLELSQKPVALKSDDPAIATVDSKGVVTAYAKGYTYITIKYKKSTERVQVLVTDPFMSYSDAKTYRVEVPTTWKVLEQMLDNNMPLTSFLSPLTGPKDSYKEHFRISNATISPTFKLKIDKAFAKDWVDTYRSYKNFRLERNELVEIKTIAGKKVPGLVVAYSFDTDEITLKILEYVYIYNQRLALFAFYAQEKDYDLFYPEVQRAIQSFRAM